MYSLRAMHEVALSADAHGAARVCMCYDRVCAAAVADTQWRHLQVPLSYMRRFVLAPCGRIIWKLGPYPRLRGV